MTAAWRGRVLLVLLTASGARMAAEGVRYFLAAGQRDRHHVESAAFIFAAACAAVALSRGRRGDREREASDTAVAFTPPPPRMPRWSLPVAVAAALLLYLPALSLGFLSDDFVLRDRAWQARAFTWPADPFWRPLPVLLFGALGPRLLHVLNVLLHGLNAWMVGRLACQLGARASTALVAAALFVSWPAGPEAVAWCSGMQDVLLTGLALAFVSSWHAPVRLLARTALACLVVALAVLTKETAVALPLLACIAWWRLPPGRDGIVLGSVTTALVAGYSVLRLLAHPLPEGYERPLTRGVAKDLLAGSFGALAAPWHRDLGTFGVALGAAVALALPLLVAFAAWRWRQDRADFSFAVRMLAWVVLSVAPVFGFFYVGPDLQGSRYVYLAAAGWSIFVANALAGASRLLRRPGVGLLVAAAAVAAFTLVLQVHLRPWRQASELRDAVLRSAAEQCRRLECGPRTTFAEVPDSVRGAYVLRNGLVEALDQAGLGPKGHRECRLAWNGASFELVSP